MDVDALLEGHRRELQLHCYRMVGSLEDAEDLVQETLLRAWRARDEVELPGPRAARAWLYRIATNACLDFLRARPRRAVALDRDAAEVPWLQPYPDRLLEPGPDAALVARETVELVFLVAIQHLPPRQRAALLLRDLLGFSARETAETLACSVPAANSALQRARATMREQLPGPRPTWAAAGVAEHERALLARFIDAHERADAGALAAILAADARAVMPPLPTWWEGRDAIVEAMATGPFQPAFGALRLLPTRANRQPAAAAYLRRPGEPAFLPLGVNVLRVEGGAIAELLSFSMRPLGPRFSAAPVPELAARFGLPPALEPER